MFRARIRAGHQGMFEALVREASVPLVLRQEGPIACHTGRPVGSNTGEFTMGSLWRDVDALRAFAGDDRERAVILDEGEAAIIAESVVHQFEAFGGAEWRLRSIAWTWWMPHRPWCLDAPRI